MDQPRARDKIELRLKATKLRDREDARRQEPRGGIEEKTRQRIRGRYREIVPSGLAMNPRPPPSPKRRGRPKRGKSLNLLLCRRIATRIMDFFEQEGVPVDGFTPPMRWATPSSAGTDGALRPSSQATSPKPPEGRESLQVA